MHLDVFAIYHIIVIDIVWRATATIWLFPITIATRDDLKAQNGAYTAAASWLMIFVLCTPVLSEIDHCMVHERAKSKTDRNKGTEVVVDFVEFQLFVARNFKQMICVAAPKFVKWISGEAQAQKKATYQSLTA